MVDRRKRHFGLESHIFTNKCLKMKDKVRKKSEKVHIKTEMAEN